MNRLRGLLLACMLLVAAPTAAPAQPITTKEPTLYSDRDNWPTYSGDHSGQRHSLLKQIDVGNVATLQTAWIYGMYLQRDMQVTPVVMDGMMYVSQYNRLDALDATTGKVIWQYQRQPLAVTPQRGTAFWRNKVFVTTLDQHLVALDARNGAIVWEVATGENLQLAGQAPIIAGGVIIVSGNRGQYGGRDAPGGFIQGYDAETGKYLWTWSALPTKDQPEYKTWGGAKPTGAPIWLSGSYDPELNLIYYGTGQPEPQWAGDPRPGDNLWSAGLVALDPHTGKMKWFFQFIPHDVHDWDAGQQSILVDAPWKGKPRKLMLWGHRNGFYYIFDRTNGEFLQATQFVKEANWLTGMDAKGRPTANPASAPSVMGSLVCPSTSGGTNWPSPSFDPDLKLFIFVAMEGCGLTFRDTSGSNLAGGYTEHPDHPWQLYTRALNAFTGEKVWDYRQTSSIRFGPGLLSTAGGVVFTGEKQGQFTALETRTGKPLWNFFTGGVITSGPITYSVDGRQYVALVSGSNVIAFALPEQRASP